MVQVEVIDLGVGRRRGGDLDLGEVGPASGLPVRGVPGGGEFGKLQRLVPGPDHLGGSGFGRGVLRPGGYGYALKDEVGGVGVAAGLWMGRTCRRPREKPYTNKNGPLNYKVQTLR